jgi:alkanesulfonate monooxygenase SsuD/methylene tetrahydromethanopterin reductase-like flavin-dependent oxidoreductase (luciferase family)
MDVAGDRFADPAKVHAIDFAGKWYKVAGPLNVNRSPQGKPLIVQAGQSARGKAFAARHAEAVFSIQHEVAGMKRYFDSLKGQLAAFGRAPDDLKIFFGLQPIVGETEEIAAAKAALHNAMLNPEAGLTILSGHLGYDLAKVALDEPIDGLKVPGIQGLFDMYASSTGATKLTLRDIAKAHARGVSVPQIVGTPARIADWMADTMTAVGGAASLRTSKTS